MNLTLSHYISALHKDEADHPQRFWGLLVCTLLIICGCVNANAQTHYEARVFLGAHAGANFSRVTFTPSVRQTFLSGANAGINFRYIEEKHFGFIIEANFEQRGWKEDFDDDPYSYSRTANFIQIPFLAHIYFGKRAKFFINAGPSVSFMVGESTKANFDYHNTASLPGFNNRNTMQLTMPVHQKVDYGISGGLGGEYSFNNKNSIYLDARFYYGLADLLKSGRTEPVRGSNSMTISVSLGYWFRVK